MAFLRVVLILCQLLVPICLAGLVFAFLFRSPCVLQPIYISVMPLAQFADPWKKLQLKDEQSRAKVGGIQCHFLLCVIKMSVKMSTC